jgi:hypothetical protein
MTKYALILAAAAMLFASGSAAPRAPCAQLHQSGDVKRGWPSILLIPVEPIITGATVIPKSISYRTGSHPKAD